MFVRPYTQPYTSEADVVDLENPLPDKDADLPCVAAIEFLADIYEQGDKESILKAIEVRIDIHHGRFKIQS